MVTGMLALALAILLVSWFVWDTGVRVGKERMWKAILSGIITIRPEDDALVYMLKVFEAGYAELGQRNTELETKIHRIKEAAGYGGIK
jgi:hypothetical protein